MAVLAVSVLAGCRTLPESEALARFEFSEPHMGSLWHITVYAPEGLTASNAVVAAFARVKALDEMMTDYDPQSELMRLSASPRGQPVPVSRDLLRILEQSQEMARASHGAFDVTVGPVVQLWRRARRQRELPAPERLAAARQAVGFTRLQLNARAGTATLLADHVRLDLGGIAKGYAADEALRVLRGRGLPRALVAASGDLAVGDPPPGKKGWRVGVGVPGSTNLAGLLLLKNAGVSTSGDAEQSVVLGGVRYSHIVDPRTGQALTNRIQATIVADCATRSDALATSVCVLGAKEGIKLVDSIGQASAYVIMPGGGTNFTAQASRRFPRFSK